MTSSNPSASHPWWDASPNRPEFERDSSEVSVADEGPEGPEGAQVAEWLFEPFASGRPGGTGLGLAIARAAADAHGGELSARPREPRGAVFTLALPALPQV